MFKSAIMEMGFAKATQAVRKNNYVEQFAFADHKYDTEKGWVYLLVLENAANDQFKILCVGDSADTLGNEMVLLMLDWGVWGDTVREFLDADAENVACIYARKSDDAVVNLTGSHFSCSNHKMEAQAVTDWCLDRGITLLNQSDFEEDFD